MGSADFLKGPPGSLGSFGVWEVWHVLTALGYGSTGSSTAGLMGREIRVGFFTLLLDFHYKRKPTVEPWKRV